MKETLIELQNKLSEQEERVRIEKLRLECMKELINCAISNAELILKAMETMGATA